MIVQVGDLGEGLAAVHALVRTIVRVDALVVPQIGRLREAWKQGGERHSTKGYK